MTTTQKLAAAIEAVGQVLQHHQNVFTNGTALLERAEVARRAFMNRIMAAAGDGTPLNIQRGWPSIDGLLDSDPVRDYIAAQAVAEAVVNSPEFIEAEAILAPLVANIRQLEAKVTAENVARGEAIATLREAEEKATAAALAKVAADPKLAALRAEIEATA